MEKYNKFVGDYTSAPENGALEDLSENVEQLQVNFQHRFLLVFLQSQLTCVSLYKREKININNNNRKIKKFYTLLIE